jgi:hypothetical protein
LDDTYDLRRHVRDMARLSQQVQQLRAQQLLDAESLTTMKTAKDLADRALATEKTRKADSADSGPCKKKPCKAISTAHSKCYAPNLQTKHQKSHDNHQDCTTNATAQRQEITKLTTSNTTLAKELKVLRAESEKSNKALMQELAEANQQAANTKSLPNTMSVTDLSSVLTSFADNAKKLIVPAPACAPVPPGSESTFTLEQLMKLKGVFN